MCIYKLHTVHLNTFSLNSSFLPRKLILLPMSDKRQPFLCHTHPLSKVKMCLLVKKKNAKTKHITIKEQAKDLKKYLLTKAPTLTGKNDLWENGQSV